MSFDMNKNDMNNSEVVIDIPEEHNVLKVQANAPKDSNPKKSFHDLTDFESKMKIFEQQIIQEGINRQKAQEKNDGNNYPLTNKKTILTRLSTQQYKNNANADLQKQRERQESIQKAESIMRQFKNRTEKTVGDLDLSKQNICYQRFDESIDNKEKKVLEMQLNLQRAEDFIEKQLPISTTSREQLMELLLDYLLGEDEKEKSMRKSLRSPKKKTQVKNNQMLFLGLANVNMAISQEIVDCTPKTGMMKQNQILLCQICFQDILGSQTIKLSSFWQLENNIFNNYYLLPPHSINQSIDACIF